MERLIAVGDIHGQKHLLQKLLEQVAPCAADQWVFLGDLIDRGPDSSGVIDLLMAFCAEFPQTMALRGNHEQMLLDAAAALQKQQLQESGWLGNIFKRSSDLPVQVQFFLEVGGWQTLQSYAPGGIDSDVAAAFRRISDRHLRFLRGTRFFYEQGQFLFVHAGVDPTDPQGELSPRAFLWERSPIWLLDSRWNKVVVHGHTPVEAPQFKRFDVNLDTGAGHGGPLTACDLLARRIWQAHP